MPRRQLRGFTLAEILVVIGIIVLLTAIVLPMVGKARREARRTRTAADLASISTALTAYKLDHGSYPSVEMVVQRPPLPPFQSTADRPNPRTGAQILSQTLLGHLPAGEANPPANHHAIRDGFGGYGFSNRPAVEVSVGEFRSSSKSYGPYVAPEKYSAMRDGLLQTLSDGESPILYFPRRAGPLSLINYVGRTTTDAEPFGWDITDNFEDFRNVGESDADLVTRMHAAFGDTNTNGNIDANAGENPTHEGEYVLWAAGPDGLFGTDDDVTVRP